MFVHIVSNAANVVGLIVGLTITGIFIFVALPITIVIIIRYCNAQTHHRVQATYASTAATAAPTTSTVVVSTPQQSTAAPTAAYPAGGYNYPKLVCMCVSLCRNVCVYLCLCVFTVECLDN